ncbi:MAG: putative protease YhbU precursor [Firmicutes bacterium ADurb.Bin146]|nr:MAG: putative protease YhbU precursor [Firmicutes bacterium ADurb.Bin146]
MQCLKAAVQNGADAVYLGIKTFSARANADNFTFEELSEAVRYCHLRDVSVYLTLNTLIDDENMEMALNNAKKAHSCGIDGIIVQDLGLAVQIRKMLPDIRLHASTQMSIIHPKEAQFLKNLGFKRIIAAREATLDQIKMLVATGIEVEVFGHGSLCVCYSGQCELSYFNGGKSGNKGSCAQPCRLSYSLFADNRTVAAKNLLSTKDIAVMDDIDKVISAGVVSLKIEGRMKSPEYVAIITKTYRKAISGTLTDKDRQDAMMVFNREGFSKGYMFTQPGKEMMAYNFSGNTGIRIGTVTKVNKEKELIQIESSRNLINGDGISFKKSGIGMYVNILNKNGNLYGLICRNGVPEPNEPVYLTYDKELIEQAQKSYSDDFNRKVLISGHFSSKTGHKASFTVKDAKNNTYTAYSDIVSQKAKNPDADEDIIKNLTKTGNTVFEFESLTKDTDTATFLPSKSVNALRRDALEGLALLRQTVNISSVTDYFPRYENISISIMGIDRKPGISLFFFENRPDFDIRDIDADRIYMPYNMYQKYYYDNRVFSYIPIGVSLDDAEINQKRIISSSIGILAIPGEKVLDSGINCLNTYTADFLSGYENVKAIHLSHELPIDSIKRFAGLNKNISYEYLIYGRVAVMKTKYCIKSIFSKSGTSEEEMYLNDRQKKRIDIVTYPGCSTTYLLGAFTINNLANKELIRKSGADTLRINIYKESKEEIKDIIQRAK